MNKKSTLNPVSAAIGTAFVISLSQSPVVNAAVDNPFLMNDIGTGYMVVAEGKCGEGKCGEKKAEEEGKCGEGKCGEKKTEEGKCGEGKCGEKKAEEEGKCGEGKCGENK